MLFFIQKCFVFEPILCMCVSYHMAETTPGPWAGHRGNWDDEQDPTSLTLAVAFLLPWRWSPVLSRGVNLALPKPLTLSILTLQFPPQPLSNPPLRFITFWEWVTTCTYLVNVFKKVLKKEQDWLATLGCEGSRLNWFFCELDFLKI